MMINKRGSYTPYLAPNGYYMVHSPKHRATVPIHRLVAEEHFGPCPPGKEVNHINGIKTDNRPENLEYVTKKENIRHGIDKGLCKSGESHYNAKMTKLDVIDIKRLKELDFVGYYRGAKMLALSPGAVHKVMDGKSWKHAEADIRSQYPNPRPEALCH